LLLFKQTGSLTEMDTTHQSLKARVVPNEVERRIDPQHRQLLVAQVISIVQPSERLVLLAQSNVDDGQAVRLDVPVRRSLPEIAQDCSRVSRAAGLCVGMSQPS